MERIGFHESQNSWVPMENLIGFDIDELRRRFLNSRRRDEGV